MASEAAEDINLLLDTTAFDPLEEDVQNTKPFNETTAFKRRIVDPDEDHTLKFGNVVKHRPTGIIAICWGYEVCPSGRYWHVIYEVMFDGVKRPSNARFLATELERVSSQVEDEEPPAKKRAFQHGSEVAVTVEPGVLTDDNLVEPGVGPPRL